MCKLHSLGCPPALCIHCTLFTYSASQHCSGRVAGTSFKNLQQAGLAAVVVRSSPHLPSPPLSAAFPSRSINHHSEEDSAVCFFRAVDSRPLESHRLYMKGDVKNLVEIKLSYSFCNLESMLVHYSSAMQSTF